MQNGGITNKKDSFVLLFIYIRLYIGLSQVIIFSRTVAIRCENHCKAQMS